MNPPKSPSEQGQQELWNAIGSAFSSSRKGPPMQQVSRDCALPLSFAQQRFWFLEQLEPDSSVNNIPIAFRLTGPLNVTALERSLVEIVRRHEVLRTIFHSVDGQSAQLISPDLTLTLPIIDLRELPETERDSEAQRQLTQEAQQPFDLAQGPLVRVKLLRLDQEEHQMILTMHHIISDGGSFKVFFQELTLLYKAFSTNKPSPLCELVIQYADFVVWQRNWLGGEILDSQLNYWKQQLGGSLSVLQLPTDHPRPAVQTYRGAAQCLKISKELTESLKSLSRKEGVTLFMTVLATFQILLFRYSQQEVIIVGSPIAGRNRGEIKGLIGCFVNSLAIRTNLSGNPSFQQFLTQVRAVTLGAYAHQDLPFEKLVKELRTEREPSHPTLFQVAFILEKAPMQVLEFSGLTLTPLQVHKGTATLDLTLELVETLEGISGWFEYNTDLFEATTIARMAGHFQILLESIVANPEQCLSDLPLLTAAEQHQLLVEWNNTQTDYPNNTCIHQLFEEQVELTPNAIAAIFENKQLTYPELNCHANQLAHYLQKLGVKPEVLVGIYLERSPLMLVALLAILKAGGAYVPIDPDYPQERIAFMLEDIQAPVLLTQQSLFKKLPSNTAHVICLDTDWDQINCQSEDNPTCNTTADNLAYVTYTSGSTGKPKGVCSIHRGVVRLVKDIDYANLNSEETFLQLAPISFDASTFEIWGSLLNGARLAILPPHPPSLAELGQAIRRYQVTTLWLTAGLFHLMVDERLEDLKPLRQLLVGGDVLSVSHVQKFLQEPGDCQLINGYGPTENTTFTCHYRIAVPTQLGNSVPIGRPISNTQTYILDRHLNLAPIGVPGELYICGDGLARGYLKRPELTEEKFIPNPFSRSGRAREQGSRGAGEDESSHRERLYKTGDLARYLPDGNIEFLGRIDNQVKIRGFRIELGEIEAILSQHPSVEQTVVIDREDVPGEKRLVAYLVPSDQSSIQNQKSQIPNQLRDFFKQKLPDYMIPSAFVLLETLPLTPNGKVDRLALPAPQQTGTSLKRTFTPPRTLTEEMLAQIWAEALGFKFLDWGKSQINIYDNFFELGGHSLVAARLISRVQEVFQIELPLHRLFEFPTLAGLAEEIETERRIAQFQSQDQLNPGSSLVAIQLGGSKRPFFLVPGGNGGKNELIIYAKLVYLLGQDQPVYGFQARGWDGTKNPHTTVEAMATDYIKEIRTIQTEGPYLLGGECIGGVVALEMAQQLVAQGQKVGLLVLMDTAVPTLPRELRYHIEGFFQIPRISYQLRKLQSLSEKDRLTYIFNLASKIKEKLAEDSLSNHFKKVAKNYVKIIKHYRPRTYPGRITWLVTESFSLNAQNQEWTHLTVGGVEIHQIRATHNSYLGNNVEATAQRLKACLDQAQADD